MGTLLHIEINLVKIGSRQLVQSSRGVMGEICARLESRKNLQERYLSPDISSLVTGSKWEIYLL